MSARGTTSAAPSGLAGRRWRPDPLRAAWALLTNVKFALVLVGTALLAGLAGTILPQLPAPMRDNPAARSAWLELRRESYGPFTGPLDAAGLFDVFHAPWFTALWALIIVAVTVCTVSRFRPTWRNVARPPRAVPDSYFEHARHRLGTDAPTTADQVADALRRRHYHVEEARRDGNTVYLFADRFAWAQYGTFVSHLALLMLLVGALLTMLLGFNRPLVFVEAAPAAPVFQAAGPGQIFVRVIDAFRGVDDRGNIIDFHTDIEVRRGDQNVSCRVTVNSPCGAFGYRVHQAAFVDDIARLRILDPGGRVLFAGTLDFEGRATAVPALRVTGPGGDVLVDEPMPQLATDAGSLPGREDDLALGALSLSPSGGAPGLSLGLAWRVDGGDLRLLVATDQALQRLAAGESLVENGYHVEFRGPVMIPATRVNDMPGAAEAGAVVQLVPRADGSTYVVITGVDDDNVALVPGGEATTAAGYTYRFDGRVEAAGLDIRRDPGDTFIWIAVGMGLLGLSVTFYVPRRRLWVRVSPGRVAFAGLAERTTRLDRELAAIARDLRPGATGDR